MLEYIKLHMRKYLIINTMNCCNDVMKIQNLELKLN